MLVKVIIHHLHINHNNELFFNNFRTKRCFFTSDSSMKKDKFMQQLNYSYQEGGLTCSFNDYQLGEFIQRKMRLAGKLPVKKAVAEIGPQEDGSWVLGPSLYFSRSGDILDLDSCRYSWIGDLYDGPKIAPADSACHVELPPTTSHLNELFTWAKCNMAHNFIPTVLLTASCVMAMHFPLLIDLFHFCPVPLAYSIASATGKTTALTMALAVVCAYPARFLCKASFEKYMELCCTSYLPLGVDDPKSQSAISDLAVALFNGAKQATIRRGEMQPHSMAVISANFTTRPQEKYGLYQAIYNMCM